jgi:hypothetical protein
MKSREGSPEPQQRDGSIVERRRWIKKHTDADKWKKKII